MSNFQIALEIRGQPAEDFPEKTAAAWVRLTRIFLDMQVAHDRIAQTRGFDPMNPDALPMHNLEAQFTTSAVKKFWSWPP